MVFQTSDLDGKNRGRTLQTYEIDKIDRMQKLARDIESDLNGVSYRHNRTCLFDSFLSAS